MSANTQVQPRQRAQPRKRPADDAPYAAPSNVQGRRAHPASAADADGPPRPKRKRVDTAPRESSPPQAAPPPAPYASSSRRGERAQDEEAPDCMVDFSAFPIGVLHSYLAQFNLVPSLFPSPLSADDPPPPSALLRPSSPVRALSPSSTPANRPRRDSIKNGVGRRSPTADGSGESEAGAEGSRRARSRRNSRARTPVLADVGDVHGALARIASRHFRARPARERETLAAFLCAVKANKGPARPMRGLPTAAHV